MAAPHSSIDQLKQALRQQMLAARSAWDPALGTAVTERVLQEAPPPSGAVVSGFWPIGQEIDIRPLLLALRERGHAIVLPQTPKRGNPLIFRLWRPGETLVPERFGTLRPDGPVMEPDVLLVPLLAFDRRGYRLGYGAGYYDLTLAALPGRMTLGVAFAAQEVDAVPRDHYDQPLDAVATERGVIVCKGS
ncbi:MAG: 5-formyltetrahydrofolate cyclo-ligase [Acetobacteraceae bacterium]